MSRPALQSRLWAGTSCLCPGGTWLRACLSTLKDTWSKRNGCFIWLERLRGWLVALSSFQNIFAWTTGSAKSIPKWPSSLALLWQAEVKHLWFFNGLIQSLSSNYDGPSSNCDWRNLCLHPLTLAPLHIHAWQSDSHLWAVCACILRWAGLLGFILPFPRCICRKRQAGINAAGFLIKMLVPQHLCSSVAWLCRSSEAYPKMMIFTSKVD